MNNTGLRRVPTVLNTRQIKKKLWKIFQDTKEDDINHEIYPRFHLNSVVSMQKSYLAPQWNPRCQMTESDRPKILKVALTNWPSEFKSKLFQSLRFARPFIPTLVHPVLVSNCPPKWVRSVGKFNFESWTLFARFLVRSEKTFPSSQAIWSSF